MNMLAILFLATAAQAAQPVPVNDAAFAKSLSEVRQTIPEIPPASHAEAEEESGSQEFCAQVLKDADSISDKATLNTCIDFYWHNPQFESPPGSRNYILKLCYRVLALDPMDAETYGNAAWLLWSKWVTWTQNPQDMPDGELKKTESIQLFENGLKANAANPDFYLEYARHMSALKDYAKAAKLYQLADELAGDDTQRVLARLGAARSYRNLGAIEYAFEWYKSVLVIDPQNQTALQALRSLESGSHTG